MGIEYIDHRLFYIINLFCVLLLFTSILLLLQLKKNEKWIGASVVIIMVAANTIFLVSSNKEINSIISISPDYNHLLVMKENRSQGDTVYYRSYYGIFAVPKERLPYQTNGDFKVKWLENDIAAVTYKDKNQNIHQFIGTYGDRGGGRSYYYVGAEIHGLWKGSNIKVIGNSDGITIIDHGNPETFQWDNMVQFGTLAVVLMKGNKAAWTIALGADYQVQSDSSLPKTGNIILYKATMDENQPHTLFYNQ